MTAVQWLAIATGTNATGSKTVLIRHLRTKISMGILSVSKAIRSKIATRMTPMAYIMIAIGSILIVNNSAKKKAGMIVSGTTFAKTKRKKLTPTMYPSLTG